MYTYYEKIKLVPTYQRKEKVDCSIKDKDKRPKARKIVKRKVSKN